MINKEDSSTIIVQKESQTPKISQNEKSSKTRINKSKNKGEVIIGENLLTFNKRIKFLVKLVEIERKQSQQALKVLSDHKISNESITDLIKKRIEQFHAGSKHDFIVNLRHIDFES